jgi:hypothetical protein
MKPSEQSDSDALLGKTLREWQIHEPLPPRFQERVWAKIEQLEPQKTTHLWERLLQTVGIWLARPSMAICYVSLLLVIGILAGYWHGRADSVRESEALGTRYVQMLDPYLSMHR